MRSSCVLPLRILGALTLAAFAVGCTLSEDTPSDSGTIADGGVVADGGVKPDGGVTPDAGVIPDGGVEPDGGVIPDAGPTDGGPVAIEVHGTWDDNWGSTTTISDETWGGTTIISYDNSARSAVTQNPADAEYNPSLFNRFVWTAPVDGSFWFCWLDFGLVTAEAAQNTTKVADASHPEAAGCGGFAWTRMTIPLSVRGDWDDNYGSSTDITTFSWGSTVVVKKDNTARYAITQNPPDAMYSPNKFNKFVWTPIVGDEFWFCWIAFGEETAAAAENTTNVADATHPESSGCGGFSWTHMRVPIEVKGTFDDNWGSTTDIATFAWGSTSVLKVNNTARYAITQNPADAMYNPGKFNKFVWTAPVNGDFWFCWIAFGEATAEAAENTASVADPTHPESSGCGGFSWTHMRTPIEVKGTFDDNWGSTTDIATFDWGSTTVVKLNNAQHYAITQNAADAEYNPGKFNKFVWTAPANGEFWFCWLTYGEETAEAAESTTNVADATDPANSGCGPFSWTQMRVPIEVKGTFDDNWGSTTDIATFAWGGTSVVKVNNAQHYAITQNPDDAEYNPSQFNKFVWTQPSLGEFWFCWITYGEDTAAEAESTTNVADDTDPANSGCGPFAWTQMRVPLSIKGAYVDDLSGATTITSFEWDTQAIVLRSEESRFAITQNASDAPINPGKFSKIVWTVPGANNDFWYCPVTTGEESAVDAIETSATADDTDPAMGGCNGFSWIHLTSAVD